MNKDVTGITQNVDGTISFDFTNNMPSGIENIEADKANSSNAIFRIDGVRIDSEEMLRNGEIYIINGEKVIKK